MKAPLFGKRHYYMYLFETLFDSTVAALVSGTFFAKLTTSLGISDATTAVLAQVGNLTIVLYLLSAFVSRSRRMKPIILSMQFAYQFLISLIYVLPLFAFPIGTTEFLLFTLMLSAKAISFCYAGAKSGWFVANIPEEKRASFFGISHADFPQKNPASIIARKKRLVKHLSENSSGNPHSALSALSPTRRLPLSIPV